jgi:hypothetical protein
VVPEMSIVHQGVKIATCCFQSTLVDARAVIVQDHKTAH